MTKTVTPDLSLNALWEAVPLSEQTFQPEQIENFPEAVQQYLNHAIAPKTLLASAVRLRMRGEIKLQRWLPFRAEQVICWSRGMIWQATVRINGIPIEGSDRLIDGEGSMRWKLLGVIPVMVASGADVTRSSAGRVQAESVWLPSVFCGDRVFWTADTSQIHAQFPAYGNLADLSLTVDQGRLETVRTSRWGNPEGAEFHDVNFGAIAEEERTFGGYTIPTRLRVGWYFGSNRFESEGEFFRVMIEDAIYC
ncbi:DUF6920 family protein [Phormidesmis priestleyi]